MSLNYCFVEGETEIKFLSEMNSNGLTKLTSVKKYNLWEINISRHLIKIKKGACVYIIFDTDSISNSKKVKFKQNIITLIENGNKIILLQQTKNLEDELCKCCDFKKGSQLFRMFSSEGCSEFKTRFIAANSVLNILQIDKGKLINKIWLQQNVSEKLKISLPKKHHKHITLGNYNNISGHKI